MHKGIVSLTRKRREVAAVDTQKRGRLWKRSNKRNNWRQWRVLVQFCLRSLLLQPMPIPFLGSCRGLTLYCNVPPRAQPRVTTQQSGKRKAKQRTEQFDGRGSNGKRKGKGRRTTVKWSSALSGAFGSVRSCTSKFG